jgi:hypothetical protein
MPPRPGHSPLTKIFLTFWKNAKPRHFVHSLPIVGVNRWDENAGPRRDAIRSQVIDALEAQEIKETGNEED